MDKTKLYNVIFNITLMENKKINKLNIYDINMEKRFHILNNIWNSLGNPDMGKFSDRLILQKKVFLLSEMGFDLGYSFRKYLYGPYSNELTSDAFKIGVKEESDVKDSAVFFEKLKKLEEGHENNPRWFELLATITFLRNKEKHNKAETIKIIDEEKPYLSDENFFEEAYNRLLSLEIISN